MSDQPATPAATPAAERPPEPPKAAAPPAPPALPGLSFLDRVTDVSDADRANSIAILGMFKVGKTTLAASIARVMSYVSDPSQVLILESESGTASIAKHYKGVQQFTLTTANGFNRTVDELTTRPHDFKVVIVDTFDKFQEAQTDLELAISPGDTRAAYGRVKKWTKDTAWKLHKAPFLVIFLFHEEPDKQENGKVIITYKLVGSAKTDLGQVFDGIFRLSVEQSADGEMQRVLQIGPSNATVTGSRWENELPNSMINPTMAKIFDLIEAPATPATTLTKE